MHEWEIIERLSTEEMDGFPIGAAVKLRWGTKSIGKVIAVRPPIGLLSGGIKCLWDDGDESGWLTPSDLALISETDA